MKRISALIVVVVLVLGPALVAAADWSELDYYTPVLLNGPVYLNDTATFAFKVPGIPADGDYYITTAQGVAFINVKKVYEPAEGYTVLLIYLRPVTLGNYSQNFEVERLAYIHYNNMSYALRFTVEPRPEDRLILDYEAKLKAARAEAARYKELYEKEKAAHQKDNAAKNKEITALKARLSNLTKQYQNATAELEKLRTKVKQYELANKELEERLSEYRELNAELIYKLSESSEGDYLEQAKKDKRAGSFLVGAGVLGWITGGVLVLVAGAAYISYKYKS